jgi:formate dehydrogenase major subunit
MSKKPRIEEYHEPAGGWGATLATGAVLWEQGVLLKSGTALLFMNKPGGFKCPSCAWPDPPPHSDPLVFCENGALGSRLGVHQEASNAGILRTTFCDRTGAAI